MDELLKLLDGSVDDVKAGLAGKSKDDLLKLQAAEKDGKKRQGALEAIAAALKDAEAAAASSDGQPANIAPADTVDTSGAPQQIVPDVDMSHPAVDADPRAGTTDVQNQIDFNDPTKSGQQAVEEALAAQGRK